MEPLWEYQYEINDWPFGIKPTGFYLTDEEAEVWLRSKEETTRRLDDTKRDRNTHARDNPRMSTSAFMHGRK